MSTLAWIGVVVLALIIGVIIGNVTAARRYRHAAKLQQWFYRQSVRP